MAQIYLKLPNGSEYPVERLYPNTKLIKAEQTIELVGGNYIIVSVETSEKLEPPIGTKIMFGGEEYRLNVIPKAEKKGNRLFTYDYLFESVVYELGRAPFLDVDATGFYRSSEFSFMGDLAALAGLLVNSANLQFGAGIWIVGDIKETDTRNLTFASLTVLAGLQQICDEFKVEFSVDTLPQGRRRLNITKIGTHKNIPFEYGYKRGVKKISRTSVSSSRVVNRIYPYGSNANLPYGYRNYSNRLRIGDFRSDFIDNEISIAQIGVHALAVDFDEIKPERIGTVSNIIVGGLGFVDEDMDFDLMEKIGENTTYLIPEKSAKITFQTGQLAGKQYEVSTYNHLTKEFKLVPATDSNGLVTPGIEPFVIHIGDKYVISDITLPQVYVTDAENRLRNAGQDYLDANSVPMVTYSMEIDPDYIRGFLGSSDATLFLPGDTIPLKDTELGIDKAIRIVSIVRNVLKPSEYTLNLADSYDINYIGRIQNTIERRNILTLIRANGLRDPLRAQMNWRNNQELLSLVFDPEGNYYSEKIKPLSIETSMLAVGARSQQFILNLVMEPNFAGQYNTVYVRAGTLVHYTIATTIKTWYIPEMTYPLTTDNPYFIYARCERNSENGIILFDDVAHKFDEDGQYYYFLIGVLHSPDPQLFIRWISLTYGATTINGRFITTGRIQSGDGVSWFDLDTGEIGGRITFRTADGDDKPIADAYQEQRDFANLVTETLGEMDGLVETWFYDYDPTLLNLPASDWNTIPLKDSHLNDTFTNRVTGKNWLFRKQDGVYFWQPISDQDINNALLLAQKALDTADGKRRVFVVQPFPPYDAGDLWKKGGDLMICIVSKLQGQTYSASDWELATNYDNTKTVIDGGLVTTGQLQLVGSDGQIKAGITGGGTDDNAIRIWAGATFANRSVAPFRVTQGGEVFARKRIEMMSASNVGQAGICGANTSGDGEVRMWAGTDYANRNSAAWRVLANGSMYATAGFIGNWQISGGGIVNDSGSAYIIMRSSTATEKTEVIIGSNVFPSTFSGKGAAVFRATEINTTGDNYAAVFYAMNAGAGFNNWALYAFDGISFLGQTLINGKKPYIANLANQFATLDPTMYDMISVYPTSGTCYVEFVAPASRRFIIGEGKEITIINRNDDFSNFYLKNIVIGFPEFYLLGGKVVTIIYSVGNWYVKSERDNDF